MVDRPPRRWCAVAKRDTWTVRKDDANWRKVKHLVIEPSTPSQVCLIQMGKIYSTAMMRRFDRFSKGGGSWAPLAQATIRARRKGRKKKEPKFVSLMRQTGTGNLISSGGQYSILRDTNQLFQSLNPQRNAGSRLERINTGLFRNSIDVGFAGTSRRNIGEKGMGSSAMTMGQLARIHHFGTKHIPARPILVDTDAKTNAQMQRVYQLFAKKVLARLKG